jgi:hypothetical protein
MAVTATSLGSDLLLIMDNGVGTTGSALTKTRTYSDIKSAAVDQDVYDVAQILIGLQDQVNYSIERRNMVELEAE